MTFPTCSLQCTIICLLPLTVLKQLLFTKITKPHGDFSALICLVFLRIITLLIRAAITGYPYGILMGISKLSFFPSTHSVFILVIHSFTKFAEPLLCSSREGADNDPTLKELTFHLLGVDAG